MSENAVKRSVLCRQESSAIQKLSVIIIINSRYICQLFIHRLIHSFIETFLPVLLRISVSVYY